MELEFHNSFSKDIDKLKDKAVKNTLIELINSMKMAKSLNAIPNVKKLKGAKNFYRIKVGDYRLGIEYSNTRVIFKRFLLRKDIYKFFP